MEEKYITELIQRMNIKEEIKLSDLSIHWKAHREAETLTDTSFYPILKNLILQNSKPKDKKHRSAAYFIMGKLLKKTPINDFIDFYLQQMDVETDKYILSSMLDLVADIIIPTNMISQRIQWDKINEDNQAISESKNWIKAFDLALNEGTFDQHYFYHAFHEFDNQDIKKSLASENPLVRMFAILDRRVGKRTLAKLKDKAEKEIEWLKRFYLLRFQVENI